MWECYKKANSYFCEQKLSDHLVVNFHKEGHAVLAEDMELIISYFNKMYFGFETSININQLKTSVFENQNQ